MFKGKDMKYYYYAHSGHKHGLDRVRRAVALIKAYATRGIEVELLVNDFRAGLAAKELGVRDSVTIETFLDIDAVAQRGDVVFADTAEEFDARIEEYAELFDPLYRIVDDCDKVSLHGEVVVKPPHKERGDDSLVATFIESAYFDTVEKTQRVLFFYGDADYDKELLAHREFFAGLDMELVLGEYFFVKYDDELAKIFTTVYENEEYTEMITSSSIVVTASIQTALEARASQAQVVYMKREGDSECQLKLLDEVGVQIINYFDKDGLSSALSTTKSEKKLPIEENISNKQL